MKIYGVLNDWDCKELYYKTKKAAREAAERICDRMNKKHRGTKTIVLDFTKRTSPKEESETCVSIFEHTVREK